MIKLNEFEIYIDISLEIFKRSLINLKALKFLIVNSKKP
jgi:hypothetical protein